VSRHSLVISRDHSFHISRRGSRSEPLDIQHTFAPVPAPVLLLLFCFLETCTHCYELLQATTDHTPTIGKDVKKLRTKDVHSLAQHYPIREDYNHCFGMHAVLGPVSIQKAPSKVTTKILASFSLAFFPFYSLSARQIRCAILSSKSITPH
jgi:hypothetical protein